MVLILGGVCGEWTLLTPSVYVSVVFYQDPFTLVIKVPTKNHCLIITQPDGITFNSFGKYSIKGNFE